MNEMIQHRFLFGKVFAAATALWILVMLVADVQFVIAQGVTVRKIWGSAPHSAFTDIEYYKGKFYVCFREGTGHVSFDGKIRVISSSDGHNWNSVALFSDSTGDLRDAKLISIPGDSLMIVGAVASKDRKVHQSKVWFSSNGEQWTDAEDVGDRNYWLWGITMDEGVAYAVGYPTGYADTTRPPTRLYESQDMKLFTSITDSMMYGTETSLCFLNPKFCIAVKRRDPENALLGRSRLPYRQWSWSDAGYRLGGPQLIMLPNGKIFGGARFYDTGKEHTALFYLNRITYKVKKYVSLPSGGDNGYPGFAIFNDTIWISYYSSHEGKASIYLAAMSLYRITEDIAHDYDSTATGVIKQDLEPVEYEVSQNYPNPFNPSTKINYLLPQNSNVRISVFNALGQKVDEIHTKEQQVGVNVAEWNASTFATGMYMMRIEAASIEHPGIRFVQTKKMLLAK